MCGVFAFCFHVVHFADDSLRCLFIVSSGQQSQMNWTQPRQLSLHSFRLPVSQIHFEWKTVVAWGQGGGWGDARRYSTNRFPSTSNSSQPFHFSNNNDETKAQRVISPTSTTLSLHPCDCVDTYYFVSTGDRRTMLDGSLLPAAPLFF